MPSHQGEFIDFDGTYCRPQPVGGDVPVVVGGHSKRAARRAGELGDGFFPGRGGPAELSELFDTARRAAESAGRDPGAIEFTAGGPTTPEYVERLAEIGVTRMVVPPMAPEQLEAFGRDVVSVYADA